MKTKALISCASLFSHIQIVGFLVQRLNLETFTCSQDSMFESYIASFFERKDMLFHDPIANTTSLHLKHCDFKNKYTEAAKVYC